MKRVRFQFVIFRILRSIAAGALIGSAGGGIAFLVLTMGGMPQRTGLYVLAVFTAFGALGALYVGWPLIVQGQLSRRSPGDVNRDDGRAAEPPCQ